MLLGVIILVKEYDSRTFSIEQVLLAIDVREFLILFCFGILVDNDGRLTCFVFSAAILSVMK